MKSGALTCPIDELNQEQRSAMWELFSSHYAGTSRPVFDSDLDAKELAILIFRDGKMTGFTSLGSVEVNGLCVAYSGDVIITPEARDIGTSDFFHQWALAVWNRYDWWCLLTSGPRTYRIAHTFYRRVLPNPKYQESEAEQTLRHQFADAIYGKQYDPQSGIVRLDAPYVMQKPMHGMRESYPLADYFMTKNPGWKKGDELVSIIDLHPDNWKPIARRMLNWKNSDASAKD